MAEDQAKDNLPPDDPEQSDPAETVHATSGETIKVTADHSRVVGRRCDGVELPALLHVSDHRPSLARCTRWAEADPPPYSLRHGA